MTFQKRQNNRARERISGCQRLGGVDDRVSIREGGSDGAVLNQVFEAMNIPLCAFFKTHRTEC